jgi:hypothetical protein
MSKLIELLLARDFDSFVNACVVDAEAVFEDDVLVALQSLKAAEPIAFVDLCAKLVVETEVDVAELKEAVTDAGKAKKGKGKKGKSKSQATLIANLAKEQGAILFHDEFKAAYASFDVNGHREVHKLRSKSFRLWLLRIYYTRLGAVPGREAIGAALALLEAVALFDGGKQPVAVRRAWHDGRLYIDICNDEWQAYEVDGQGWRLISNPPVYFIRSPSMQALPLAEHGNSKDGLKRLRKLVRVRSHDDFVVLVGFLLDALGGAGPFTVLNLTGEPGSTKTTLLKLMRSLTDPNAGALAAARPA